MKTKTHILTPATSAITSEMVDQYRQRDAVDEKFERITPQTQVEILTDERGDVGWALCANFFSVAVASTVGFRVGYQHGFHTYYNAYIDALFENVHYVGNRADCPECDEESSEWFFADPPTDIHQLEEEVTFQPKKEGKNETE